MKNTVKTIFGLAALALVAAGCNVTDPRPTYVPEGDGVTFVQQVVSAGALDPSTTTYYVDLSRGNAEGELTVNISSSVYNNNDTEKTENLAESFFNIPSSVTFADGEYLAKISIDVSKMEIGEKFSGTLAIAEGEECFNPNTATTSVSITLAKDYNWVDLGEGQWFDSFLFDAVQTVSVRAAEGYGIYRVYDPYPTAYMEIVGGGAFVPENSTSVPEYLEFTVDENGKVSWGNDNSWSIGGVPANAVYTGYVYAENGGFYYFQPSALDVEGDDDNITFEDGKILQIVWAPYCPEAGIWWGGASSAYLALPSFEGDLGAYLGL